MNLELVEQIVVLLGEYPVSEIAVETQNSRVHVRRPLIAAATAPVQLDLPLPETLSDLAVALEETQVLSAPMVGIFYHSEPPWMPGTEIRAGQVAGCIESMKLLNDVAAGAAGQITEVLVEDGAPVEYGQSLFRFSAV